MRYEDDENPFFNEWVSAKLDEFDARPELAVLLALTEPSGEEWQSCPVCGHRSTPKNVLCWTHLDEFIAACKERGYRHPPRG